jgi:two-component system chemotaxis response regulator CheY
MSVLPSPDPISIVFVDDEPAFLQGIRRNLHHLHLGWDITYLNDPREALERFRQPGSSVIISDWMMNELEGPQLCRLLREYEEEHPATQHYIILLTGRQDGDSVSEGLDSGADDFLAKPFHLKELLARIRVGVRQIELQGRLRRANEQLFELATVDPLTGSFNRRRGTAILQEELERVRRNKQHTSVLLIDFDKFKTINDTYGHAAGDTVLREVVRRLKNSSRRYDSLVRWGGDELLAICPYATEEEAYLICERFRAVVNGTEIELEPGKGVRVSISIGAYTINSGEAPLDEIVIAKADEALYQVKAAGGNQCCVLTSPAAA